MDGQTLPQIERWRTPGRQAAFKNIEVVDRGAKPRYLVVAPLAMIAIKKRRKQKTKTLVQIKIKIKLQ